MDMLDKIEEKSQFFFVIIFVLSGIITAFIILLLMVAFPWLFLLAPIAVITIIWKVNKE